MFNNFLLWRASNENNFVLLSNYLLIIYAFFLPISDTATRAIFTVILILFIFSGDIKKKLLFALKDKVVQAFILFFLMHIVWIIGSENLHEAIFKVKSYRYILYIIIYIALIQKDFIYKILTGFIFGILFSEMVSYFMLFDIHFDFITYTGTGINVPFMNSYTQYAEMLSISMGILLYGIIYKQQNIYYKALSTLFFISASANIFIIQSKLGYGLYTISILTVTFMILIKYKKYIMIPIAIFLIFGGYFTAYNLSSVFKNRVDGFFNQTEMAVESRNYHTSTGIRIGYYNYAIDFFKENFLFGVGTSDHSVEFLNFIEEHEENKQNIIALRKGLSAGGFSNFDSELLDISVQFGILGLIILFNIFWQLYNYKVDDYYLKVIQVIFITILLTTSMASGLFMYSKIGKIFTLLSALTLKLYYEKKDPIL